MSEYSYTDTYDHISRYEHGVDAKIVVMGNTGVGKTSLLQRYTQNKFEPKNTTATTGAFFVTKKVFVNGLKVRLQLWDTAGQERFRSMAPMYYRGANAALLLYDITSASSFDDIRGWLEELKKNCLGDLIIYIVGSKADLQRHRQVTADRARLALSRWFPPPRAPSPPPPPPPPSTLSYIRPRFTSFTSSRSIPAPIVPRKAADDNNVTVMRTSGLQRSNTALPREPRGATSGLARSHSTNTSISPRGRQLQSSRFRSQFGPQTGGYNELGDGGTSSNSVPEEEEEEDESEWGLQKGMALFEVSAKDDTGIKNLFDTLLSAIIVKKDCIEKENEQKRRDSVYLTSVPSPTWASQADEEEAMEKARSTSAWGSCCGV